MIIINADDFGMNRKINDAIIAAFKSGICSSTTIMSNMEGFEYALESAEKNRINNIGIHLVLTEGEPLTEEIKSERIFCDNEGRFCFKKNKNVRYNTIQKRVLYEELRAQVKKCRDNGLKLTHIDSHHHIHNELEITKIINVLAVETKINAIRLSRNIGKIDPIKMLYKKIHNRHIKKNYMNVTNHFGGLRDVEYEVNKGNYKILDSCEIMIHPKFNNKGEIVDLDNRIIIDTMNKINSKYEIRSIQGY